MRIGFDAKRIFFNRSGLGNYGRNILSALFAFHPENNYFLFSPPTPAELFPEGKPNIITPHGIYNFFPTYWRNNHIGHDARQHHLNIYHGLSNELPHDIQSAKVKSVVSIHDTIFMHYPQWYKWHDRIIYKQKTAFACKEADAIIAISQQTKNDLIHFFNVKEEKIHLIYQPCNSVFLQKPDEKKQEEVREKYQLPSEFILMVGNIEPRKNVLNVIKAVQDNHRISIPLVIVGKENKYAGELKKYIRENNIKNVYFCHNVCSLDLPAVYRLATVFIYPSFFEGFGIPVIEALSCEIPVITSDTSCLRETAAEAALYVTPDNVGEISNRIYALLSDNHLRNNLIEKGKEQVKLFNAETIVRKIINLYKAL